MNVKFSKGLKPTSRELAASDKWLSAIHEAGHCIVAQHFKMNWNATIERVGKPTPEDLAYVGHTWYLLPNQQLPTAFQQAVLAWGGVIAEYLFLSEIPVDEWPKQSLESFKRAECYGREISPTDQLGVTGHPQRQRALKMAWNIVLNRRDDLMRIADTLKKRMRVSAREFASTLPVAKLGNASRSPSS
jgi:hypothetical protein